MINIGFQQITGRELYSEIKKYYTKGLRDVVRQNKKVLKLATRLSRRMELADPRDPFKVDWTVQDLEALMNFRIEAFTVAGVGSYDLQEDLKKIAIDIFNGDNIDKAEFIRRSKIVLMEYLPIEDIPPSGWLLTNFNTATASAYHGAEWIRLQDPLMQKIYPAYKYMTRHDTRVRPEHAARHGQIYYANDPIWKLILPPNGWNCRCFYITVDSYEMRDEVVQPMTDEETRKRIVAEMQIAPQFQRNSGDMRSIYQKWIDEKLQEINVDVLYDAMVDYAKKVNSPINFNIDKELISSISGSMGFSEKRQVKDFNNDRLILTAPEDAQKNIAPFIRQPDEIWGRTFEENGIITSQSYYIKYTKDGVVVVTVKGAEIVNIELLEFEAANRFRTGTLIHKSWN